MTATDTTQTLRDSLTGIGIAMREAAVPAGSFLPGIRLEAGGIAGGAGRPHRGRPPGAPHRGEAEATAWAWAALVHLGLPAEVLFHGGGYQGHSAGLALTYSVGVYPGAAGLTQAGLAAPGEYPRLRRWLRDQPLPSTTKANPTT